MKGTNQPARPSPSPGVLCFRIATGSQRHVTLYSGWLGIGYLILLKVAPAWKVCDGQQEPGVGGEKAADALLAEGTRWKVDAPGR